MQRAIQWRGGDHGVADDGDVVRSEIVRAIGAAVGAHGREHLIVAGRRKVLRAAEHHVLKEVGEAATPCSTLSREPTRAMD